MDEADRHRLTEAQHERIFERRIVPQLTSHVRATGSPRAVILGGQPGAGKSALQSAVERELDAVGGVLAIIGDDLRAYHPKYARLIRADDKRAAFYTDRDSALWIEKLIGYAQAHCFNLLIESTMRRPDKIVSTASGLRASGYRVEACALAVHERWSLLGIHQRYEAMLKVHGRARFTLEQAHTAAYVGMLQTLDQLELGRHVDRIAVYARGNVVLYDNAGGPTGWLRPPAAREAVEAERARRWSAREKIDFAEGWHHLLEQRRARGAARDDLIFARTHRNRALLEVQADSAARDELEQRVSQAQREAYARITAVAAFELLDEAKAVRMFPALEPYFAERARLGPTTAAQLERLSAELEQSFPKPPEQKRSRRRGR